MVPTTVNDFDRELSRIHDSLRRVEEEFAKRIVGNTGTLRFMEKALLSGGHVLLEGVPGLGKTLMVKTLAEILDLRFRRIQFTPDLLPADIVGTNIIVEDERRGRSFRFEEGPVFTHILLADEVNRASPKTQSALLQAMEEHEATVFGQTHPLDPVFFTLATQNPIEMAGTYPLPEAQMDRFMFKLDVEFPDLATLGRIARLTTGPAESMVPVEKVLTREEVLAMRDTLRRLPIPDHLYSLAAELIHLTHPASPRAPERVRRFVRVGASPRGLHALLAAARVSAVMDGRANLALPDLEENLLPALRHRLVLGFEAEVERVHPDEILRDIFAAARKG